MTGLSGWVLPPGISPSEIRGARVLGTEAVADFGDERAEHAAVRSGAGILPAPWERYLRVTGRDARALLQNLLTQDIASLAPGRSAPAALASPKGHLLCPLRVLARDDGSFDLRVQSDRIARLVEALDRHRIREQASWTARPEGAAFLLLGPGAGALGRALGLDLEEGTREGGEASPFGPEALWMRVRETGSSDLLIFLPPDQLGRFWEASRAAVPPGRPVGWSAFNLARIEAGRAWFGLDADEHRLVPEPGYDDHVSYTKGCYLGQETLARLHHLGKLNWKIRTLAIEGEAPPVRGVDLLTTGSDRVGWITSVARHPAGGFRALGYLHRRFLENPGALRLRDGSPVSLPTQPSDAP
jgi:folate-binding protein YgfZ